MIRIWQQSIIAGICLLLLAGCISRDLTGSIEATDLPAATPVLPSPQPVATLIPWHVDMHGETDGLVYEFIVNDGEQEITMQQGKETQWQWRPEKAGTYRIKVVATDPVGNRTTSDWSKPYEVVQELKLEGLKPDKPAPQAANTAIISWEATASGGAGKLTYTFTIGSDKGESVAQSGAAVAWKWQPEAAGAYRIKVVVSDTIGNSVASDWNNYEIASEIKLEELKTDQPAPQAAKTTVINWQATATGGVGELIYAFTLADGKDEVVVQQGPSSVWQWQPEEAGTYRIKVVATDTLGNKKASDWVEYVVAPELELEGLKPDKPAPQAANMTAISWQATATGGVGELTYTFSLADDKGENVVQSGPSPTWQWQPPTEGSYRVKVVVKDIRENTVASDWSEPYAVAPELKLEALQMDKPSPQISKTTVINWQAAATGGVGELTYSFAIADDKGETVSRSGAASTWQWQPEEAGTYRIKVVATDTIGNSTASDWVEYVVAPELKLEGLKPDKPAPQAANMTAISWQATATGGAGELTYTFSLADDKGENVVQSGPSPTWQWQPPTEGSYRIKVVVKDIRENTLASNWSEPYTVAPELKLEALQMDKPSPQASNITVISWQAAATGGVGELTYAFILADEKGQAVAQSGDGPLWKWRPEEAGTYRIRVVVSDTIGNSVSTDWVDYQIAPKLSLAALRPDKPAPQAANMTVISWQATATGGVGELTYTFTLADEQGETTVQQGPSPTWQWQPLWEGSYRVKAEVKDTRENTVASDWSEPYAVAPELSLDGFQPDKPSPQASKTTVINWQAEATGGVGKLTYSFTIADDKGETVGQSGTSPIWQWRPQMEGTFTIRVIVSDTIGNSKASDWTEYEITPELKVKALRADKPSPQKAGIDAITLQVDVKGGVPPLAYEFISRHNGKELIEQQGEKAIWKWRPLDRGQYQFAVKVHDAEDNSVGEEESVDFEIVAPLGPDSLIAVFPVQNMSGAKAPVKKIQDGLEEILRLKGIRLVDEQTLQDFIVRHRIRFTGGIDSNLARALKEETGAQAVLLSVLDLYREATIPKMSLTVWLDSCIDPPGVLWIDSKSMSGDANPGLLDLGMIKSADQLLDKMLESLFESWEPTLMPASSNSEAKKAAAYWGDRWQDIGGSKFRPKEYYRSESYSPNRRYTVAVMPFYNLSERKYAGEIIGLHFVRQLRQVPNLAVTEPGELRQYLLQYRIIMQDGLSLAHAEVIFAKLGVDLIVTGKIFDYEDYIGTNGKPIVDFSVEVFSRDGNKTIWTSKSYTNGEKGVFFFDFGKIYTAHNLADQMVGTISRMLGK